MRRCRPSAAGLAALARALTFGLGLALLPFAGLPDASGRFAAALADDDGGGDDGGGGGGTGGGAGGGGPGGGGGGGGSAERSSSGRHIRSFNLFGLFGGGQSAPRQSQRSARPQRPAVQAVPREIVAAGLTEADIARLREEGFRLVAQRSLGLVGNLTVRMRVPRRLSTARAVERVRTLFPAALVDLNHLYRGVAAPCPDNRCFSLLAPEARIAGSCVARGTIGMVDTGVDLAHPALAGKAIETESVREPGYKPAGDAHGTDVAILLTRNVGGEGARIVAVDAFHRHGGSANADSFDLSAALDLLAGRQVPVVNLSLAGPANVLVERIGSLMHARGAVLVAAAGNDGPGAEPRYPAAYPWAVAVTAIDRDGKVYARANQGTHLAFAAPGVRIQFPDKAMRPGPPRSGTSYAAPLVTLAFAHRRMQDEKALPQALLAALSAEARDLGAPGRDPVFGWGSLSCSP